ncbi:hypothetical protein BLNAU_16226 [Blattamonas nauphoetae]|uniref:Uncharacterized protein n=1 Tax=Blattamonas nauphoetae TaxID=2049346 RepID=A0ABQ9X8T5_9EUKA|nr:hypothetical protein BLNAU_16226 [Blattamonas nauphoetae]
MMDEMIVNVTRREVHRSSIQEDRPIAPNLQIEESKTFRILRDDLVPASEYRSPIRVGSIKNYESIFVFTTECVKGMVKTLTAHPVTCVNHRNTICVSTKYFFSSLLVLEFRIHVKMKEVYNDFHSYHPLDILLHNVGAVLLWCVRSRSASSSNVVSRQEITLYQ